MVPEEEMGNINKLTKCCKYKKIDLNHTITQKGVLPKMKKKKFRYILIAVIDIC